jgi:RNA polymerase sigma-70 factor (ECF subfamily)
LVTDSPVLWNVVKHQISSTRRPCFDQYGIEAPGHGAIAMTDGRWGGVLDHLRRAALRHDAGEPSDAHLLDCFLARRDETAFEALVRRHGPMVLGVCRRVLRDDNDAEDAFQAAFLVLVRKAGSIRPRGLVGHWLYGVAYRTALEARGILARRRAKERQVSAMPEKAAAKADAEPDVRPIFDEELNRLPAKYRVPVVSCELEGRSRKEVAALLRIPEGTLSSRLAMARRMLAARLSRRGLGVSGATMTACLAEQASAAAVPAPLVAATVKAATQFAAGAAAAAISTNVLLVTEGVLKAMFLSKVKTVTAVFALMAILGGGIGLVGSGSWAGQAGDGNSVQAKPADLKKGGGSAKIEAVQNKDVEKKLQVTLSVNYKDKTLEEILEELRETSGLNIFVDKPSLEAAGIALGQPVSLRLKGVTLKTALKYVLRNSGLTYVVEDGIVTITSGATPGNERVSKIRRVYPVGDLVGPSKDAEDLIRVIRYTVDTPRGWAPRSIPLLATAPGGVGGAAVAVDEPFQNLEGGTIEYFAEGKSLVVSQTREIQDQIQELLDELRISKKQQEGK